MMIPKQLTPSSPTVLLMNLKTRSLPYKIAVMAPVNRTNVLKTVRNVFRDFNFLPPFVKLLDNSDLSIILGDGFSLSIVINRKNKDTALAVLFNDCKKRHHLCCNDTFYFFINVDYYQFGKQLHYSHLVTLSFQNWQHC